MADLSMDSYWQLPAMARTAATAAFALSICIHLGLVPGWWFVWYPRYLWMIPPQIWRFITSFLITGPKMGLLLDPYFLYSYMSQLEVNNPRFPRKEDMIWYLMFVGGTIMTLIYLSGFGFTSFLSALIVAMCYTTTQEQRGMKANYMVVTIPAQMAPYVMLLMNLLFPGGAMNLLLQIHGLLAAHLFDFLTTIWPQYGGGKNLLPTPAFLTTVVGGFVAVHHRLAVALGLRSPYDVAPSGSGSAVADNWRARGAGKRLG
ncbi:hypothetical protein DCS_05723 [Drechmeria coniospora]|uniref:Derlin n=1 Tax=Drechmeria coniospora TaxID=98403 RepID=A0A151GNN7_DRECN|nr:hypothetical protein DCS_05723 [Drechmeria coniospora]KYK58706.1 hypothetical protein DCS_05723 [Drechmeria coniospora]ODA84072.1 hypothetical protein RJ55_02590 [Drechmeria coniospora]